MHRPPPSVETLLDDLYLRRLHRSLFGDVWTWAGRYRRRERNIGVEPGLIVVAVRDLLADCLTWVGGPENGAWIAARLHHRLVAIHPFPIGIGRHARHVTDLLVQALGQDQFTWGSGLDLDTAALRARYLGALRRADTDRDDLADLVAFVTSMT